MHNFFAFKMIYRLKASNWENISYLLSYKWGTEKNRHFKIFRCYFHPFPLIFRSWHGSTNIFSWSKYIRFHEKNPTGIHFSYVITQNMVKKEPKNRFFEILTTKNFWRGGNFRSFCRASKVLSNEKKKTDFENILVFELLVKM